MAQATKAATSEAATNSDVVRYTAIGAAAGAVVGFLLAFHDSQSLTMLFAYGMDVTMAMAFMGGLIGANCVRVHDH